MYGQTLSIIERGQKVIKLSEVIEEVTRQREFFTKYKHGKEALEHFDFVIEYFKRERDEYLSLIKGDIKLIGKQ